MIREFYSSHKSEIPISDRKDSTVLKMNDWEFGYPNDFLEMKKMWWTALNKEEKNEFKATLRENLLDSKRLSLGEKESLLAEAILIFNLINKTV